MGRRELRENTFVLLFRKEFHDVDGMKEQTNLFFQSFELLKDEDKLFINQRIENILENVDMIDAKIDELAEGWKVSRMSKVDLSILRLAYYEILFDESVPTSVAINEAVELAKKFGGDDSPAFVNGILAKLV